MIKRFPDWITRLEAFIKSETVTPFVWGENDCCLFAANAIKMMTGTDIAAIERGTYASKRQCLKTYKSAESAVQAAAERNKMPLVKRPSKGDLVLVRTSNGVAAGICLGATVVAKAPHGLAIVDRSEVIKSWMI